MEGDVVGDPATSRVALGWPPAPPRPAVSSGPYRDLITLTQPRPGVARKQNEYIETPLRPQLPASKSSKSRLKESENVAGQSGCAEGQRPGFRGGAVPITAQPTISTFKKEKVPPDALSTLSGSSAEEDPATHQDSIICRQCRKCKCQSCRTPRPLPSRWICNDKCLCSASSVVNYCTCVCCVKGLFYHWAKDYEMDTDVSCADQPCSCSPHQRCLRWGCLGFLSLALPCLCCYWPLRGCLKACETCYTRCTARGCRCSAPQHRTVTPTEQAPEKRLLDTNSDC